MDVIALHAAGFPNAVATLGTSLTAEQARIMTKYTKKVLVSYDSDEAGQRAADRAIRILGDVGLDVRVLKLPGAKDPDEFIKKFGADRLRSVLNESKTWFDFKAEAIFAKYDLETTGGRLKASEEICNVIATVPSQIEREVYITQTAPRLGLTVDVMKNNVSRLIGKMRAGEQAKNLNAIKMSIQNYGDRINPDAVKNVAANACEEGILGLLLMYEEHRAAVAGGKVSLHEEDFFTELGKRIFTAIMELHASEGGFMFALLGERFTADEMGRIERMIQARDKLTDNGTRVLCEHIDRLREATRHKGEKAGLDDLLKAKRQQLQDKKTKG
jgi:DNA primase